MINQYKKERDRTSTQHEFLLSESSFRIHEQRKKINDSENILAYIEGSEKINEIIVVSAHYDHVGMNNGQIYNGADDDGSGTVGVGNCRNISQG